MHRYPLDPSVEANFVSMKDVDHITALQVLSELSLPYGYQIVIEQENKRRWCQKVAKGDKEEISLLGRGRRGPRGMQSTDKNLMSSFLCPICPHVSFLNFTVATCRHSVTAS